MARLAVTSYLESEESKHGPEHADMLWRRVQAGFILADSVRTTPRKFKEPVTTPPSWDEGIELSEEDLDHPPLVALTIASTNLLNLFKRKSAATKGLHSAVGARIGGRPISVWLSPEVMEEEGEDFLEVLANSPGWIKPGDSEGSRLYKEFSWGGRMFGVSRLIHLFSSLRGILLGSRC